MNIISDKNSLLDGLLQELIKKVQEVMREVRELFGSSLGGQMLSQNQKQLTPVLKAPNGLVWSSSLRHADIEINGNQATRTADTTEGYWACCLADIGKNRAANWSIRIIEQTSKAMAVGIISESFAKGMKFDKGSIIGKTASKLCLLTSMGVEGASLKTPKKGSLFPFSGGDVVSFTLDLDGK